MKRAIFRQHGIPTEVIELIEEPDPEPGPGEVRVRLKVMTINPADLLLIEGRYGTEPVALPATPGSGAYGLIDAVGPGVERLKPGDPVLPIARGLWREAVVVPERLAPRAPRGADPEQAALMRANPATAELMLTTIAAPPPGCWIAQNAANSAVGRLVIRYAREKGWRTVNVVRRTGLEADLRAEGADAVVVAEGDGATQAILAATGGERPRLAFDAVGGRASAALAAALAPKGTLVVYGLLSGEPPEIEARDLVFRDIRVRGFWLAAWYTEADAEAIRALNARLAERLLRGETFQPVAARYPLAQIREALAHAARGGRAGKILLTAE